MIRRRDNISIYKVVSQDTGNHYCVELLRLENNYYGNPRFEAHIISINSIEKYDDYVAWVYRFTGHYYGNKEEAEFIAAYHEKKIEQAHKN